MLTNLRTQFTLDDRKQAHLDILNLRPYLLPILMERQGNTCNACNESAEAYDIDHVVYHPKVSINELQALCIPCHKAKTDFRPLAHRT